MNPIDFPSLSELADAEAVRNAERRSLGFCLTTHPCRSASDAADQRGAIPLADVDRALYSRADKARVFACCPKTFERQTRAGLYMGIMWLEDDRSRREAVCFPRSWDAVADAVENAGPNGVLLLEVSDDGDGKLIVHDAETLVQEDDSGAPIGDFIVVDTETTIGPELLPPPNSRKRKKKESTDSAESTTSKFEISRLRVVEIGVAVYRAVPRGYRGGPSHVLQQQLSRFIDPGCPIDAKSTEIHGIKDSDVASQPPFSERAAALAAALASRTLVTYNGRRFDLPVLAAEFARAGVAPPPAIADPALSVDAYDFIRTRYRGKKDRVASKRLSDQCAFHRVSTGRSHRASDDATATGALLVALREGGWAPRSLARLQGRR